jgi:hypothetical protein
MHKSSNPVPPKQDPTVSHVMSFDQRIMPHLHALAAVLLAQKMYGRLSAVTSVLAVFSAGGWSRLGHDERAVFVKRMATDFHARAWDDWDYTDKTFSTIQELIYAEQRALQETV